MMLGACQLFDPSHPPSGWKVEPIGKRIDLEYGAGLTDAERREGRFPVFGSNGVVGNHDAFLVEGPGVLIGRKGSVGEVHFTEKDFWPIDTVYYVRLKKADDLRFIAYMLEYLKLGRLNAATGVPGLTRRDALFMFGAFPEGEEQTRIAETLKAADDHIRALEEQIRKVERVAVALDQTHFAAGPHSVRFPYEYGTTRTIPHGWASKKLGKIADVTSGITLNQDREAADNGVRYLTVVNVYRGRIDLTEERYLESRGNEAVSKRLNRHDILVVEGHANPGEIGRAALVSEREVGMSFQNHLFRVRLENEDEIRARFLVRALNSPRVRRHWVAIANTSSGLSTINRTGLRRLIIPLPKPQEQDLIIERLEAAEEQGTALSQQLIAARRVKQSLLQSLLTGKIRLNP